MLRAYSECCKVLPSTYNNGPLISPGLFRQEYPLLVPYPINEKINCDKVLNVPSQAGSVVEPKEKLIINSPNKPIPLPKVNKKVDIGTKRSKRKPDTKDQEEIDFTPTKIPKSTNPSKYRLKSKDL